LSSSSFSFSNFCSLSYFHNQKVRKQKETFYFITIYIIIILFFFFFGSSNIIIIIISHILFHLFLFFLHKTKQSKGQSAFGVMGGLVVSG
jgi:hypothetical protein